MFFNDGLGLDFPELQQDHILIPSRAPYLHAAGTSPQSYMQPGFISVSG